MIVSCFYLAFVAILYYIYISQMAYGIVQFFLDVSNSGVTFPPYTDFDVS